MNNDFIFDWWMKKYTPSIITFINVQLQFEELEPEALANKRKVLILEYVNESDGGVFEFLIQHMDNFFDRVYKAIYEQIQV